MKIAHLADIHLDSAFARFPPDVARGRRQGIEDALQLALTVAAKEGADAVFIAGDLYEHDRVTPNTAALLTAAFAELAPVPVLIAPGNHDWYGLQSLYARMKWPDNVFVFTEDRLRPRELADGLTVWGGAHCAPANTDGFLNGFSVERGGVNIGLFHGSEQSSLWFQGDDKVPHAPFRADQIETAGLTHVFTGHFHAPVDGDLYTYPGNPEPLAFGEVPDPPRGLVLATVAEDGSVDRERIRVAQTEVAEVQADVTDCADGSDVRELVRSLLEGRSGCARVTISGELAPEVDLGLSDLERVADWVDCVVARPGALTIGYDLEAIREESTVRGEFVADVLSSDLPEDVRRKVIVTGLRALEGRSDLEVL